MDLTKQKEAPWLQKLFPDSYPYPQLLGKGIQRKLLPFATPLPGKYCCTWRGGGFRDECKEFFENMMGKYYRVPGLLATSIEYRTACKFIRRAHKAHPRILWCILVDKRGRSKSEFRCKHASFMYKTEIKGEMEFLFTAYSVFKVVRVDFSPQDWSKPDSRYTVVIEATIDNDSHDDNLPLAPWS